MTQRNLSIDSFKSVLKGGGARKNLFVCDIIFNGVSGVGDLSNMNFFIKTAKIPESSVSAIEVPFRGHKLKVAGDREFGDYSINVINDTDFAVRKFFEQWLQRITNHKAATGMAAPGQYYGTAIISQLDKSGRKLEQYTLHNVFPTSVGEIELSFEGGDIEEFDVGLAYTYWDSTTIAQE